MLSKPNLLFKFITVIRLMMIPIALVLVLSTSLLSCEKQTNTSQLSVGSCLVNATNEGQRQADFDEINSWQSAVKERYDIVATGSVEEDYLEDLEWVIKKALEKIKENRTYLAVRDRQSRLHAVSVYVLTADRIYVNYVFTRPHFDQNRISGSGLAALVTLFEQFPTIQRMDLTPVASAESFYKRFGFQTSGRGYQMTVSRKRFFEKYEEWRALRNSSNSFDHDLLFEDKVLSADKS